jgi:LAS superfamily LD-carboxypeptidase LdcB
MDTIKPVITLKGNSNVTLYLNNTYSDEGAVATDNYDGDITDKIVISGTVDNKKVGKYEITYTVKDTTGNETSIVRTINVKEKPVANYSNEDITELTYIKGILVVNKKYGLPKTYNPGENKEAKNALSKMQADASALGLSLKLISGFRTYSYQAGLYNRYVQKDGQAKADTYSARPGHSEHQTGLAFDVGQLKDSFGDTPSGKWLAQNCHLYGFIIRYPKGKSHITGYKYEPWHIRYLGIDVATKVKESGLTLEEYLGIN